MSKARDSLAGKVIALHAANQHLIPSTTYGQP